MPAELGYQQQQQQQNLIGNDRNPDELKNTRNILVLVFIHVLDTVLTVKCHQVICISIYLYLPDTSSQLHFT